MHISMVHQKPIFTRIAFSPTDDRKMDFTRFSASINPC